MSSGTCLQGWKAQSFVNGFRYITIVRGSQNPSVAGNKANTRVLRSLRQKKELVDLNSEIN